MTLLETLRARGCLQDASHYEELNKLLEQSSLSFYCGFDPTADSLHVGSMLPLILMRRLQEKGHTPIVVLGAATGMIGDPSGKSEERKFLSASEIAKNILGIEAQIKKFLSASGKNAFQIKRNDEWLNKLSFLDFLRDVGKHSSVNQMLAKDSVKARLENREQGISYTEFSYMLLQAYDFFWLNEHLGCRLQVGGSDQWGNITAGLDLIRRKNPAGHAPAYGMTFPLLMTSSGTKFGKTEQGAVWLDAKKTSPYQFYQYWMNTADADVIRYLLLFTSVDGEELRGLETSLAQNPQAREAQQYLAAELTTLVHGKSETERAKQASKILFGESFENVDSKTLLDVFQDVPSTLLSATDLSASASLIDLLVRCGIASSKSDARRSLEGGGVYVNNEKIKETNFVVSKSHFVDGNVLVIRSGKKNYHLVKLN